MRRPLGKKRVTAYKVMHEKGEGHREIGSGPENGRIIPSARVLLSYCSGSISFDLPSTEWQFTCCGGRRYRQVLEDKELTPFLVNSRVVEHAILVEASPCLSASNHSLDQSHLRQQGISCATVLPVLYDSTVLRVRLPLRACHG